MALLSEARAEISEQREAAARRPPGAAMRTVWQKGRFIVLLLVVWALLLGVQFRDNAFAGGSALHGDEGPHFLNALLIKDYIAAGMPGSPIRFAERFFVSYPKIAPMAWPPLFDVTLAAWLLIFPDTVASALCLVSLLTASAAILLFQLSRRASSAAAAALVTLAFCSLHITQQLNSLVMMESMLALLSLAFAWSLAVYMNSPSGKNAFVMALLGAACCLTKGNGLAALLSAPIAFVLAGKWRLGFRSTTLKAALLTIALSVAPLYMAFRVINRNQILHASLTAWLPVGAATYTAALVRFCTPALAVFAAWGILRTLYALFSKPPLAPLPAAMLAGALAVIGFHIVFPHPSNSRYMFAAVPFCLYFIPAGAPAQTKWKNRSTTAWTVLAIALYIPMGLSFRQATPAGFRQALAYIRQAPGGERVRALIASDDSGESAFIVAAAESNAQRNDIIVRSSKLLVEADWFRRRVKNLVDTPENFVAKAEALGLSFLVFDRSRLDSLPELGLIDEAIRKQPDRLRKVAAFPESADQLRTIEVYRLPMAANPPRELVHYKLPYSLGREVSEDPH